MQVLPVLEVVQAVEDINCGYFCLFMMLGNVPILQMTGEPIVIMLVYVMSRLRYSFVSDKRADPVYVQCEQ